MNNTQKIKNFYSHIITLIIDLFITNCVRDGECSFHTIIMDGHFKERHVKKKEGNNVLCCNCGISEVKGGCSHIIRFLKKL